MPSATRARALERAPIVLMLGMLLGISGILAALGLLAPSMGIGGMEAGRIGLAAVFLFTGIGHFVRTREMAEMLPPNVPARIPIIQATGIFELALAAALVAPATARAAGLAAMAFLIAVFPANVSAAGRRVNFGGHGVGPPYLAARLPLQLLLIAWAYWFAVR